MSANVQRFKDGLSELGERIAGAFSGGEGSIPGGTQVVGDTAGEETSQTTSTEGADETQVPYLGAAGAAWK